MKTLIALPVLMTLSLSAFAAAPGQTCAQLEAVYKADQMNSTRMEINKKNPSALFIKQLKETARFFDSNLEGDDDLDSVSNEYLIKNYDPIYTRVHAGPVTYDTVNIDLGDNSFIAFFFAGTDIPSGIFNTDGSLSSGDEYCKNVEFEAYMKPAHKKAICQIAVNEVNKQTPKTRFTMDICLSETPDQKTKNVTDWYVEEFDQTQVAFSVQRNFADLGGGYFSCSGILNRQTSAILEMNCKAH